MPDALMLVSGIEEKILKLIGLLTHVERKLKETEKENQLLKQTNEKQSRIIQELEEKITILKTVKTLETKEGTVEAKTKLNEILREIDHCIGLLNV